MDVEIFGLQCHHTANMWNYTNIQPLKVSHYFDCLLSLKGILADDTEKP